MNEIIQIKAIKIQKWFRGCILRLKQLPLIMYKIQLYLKLRTFQFSTQNLSTGGPGLLRSAFA